MQTEKRWSILSNFLWTKRVYDKALGKKYHLHIFGYVVLSVVVPFISMAFSSTVVGALQMELLPMAMLGIIVGYAILLKGLSVAHGYVQNAVQMDMFLGRVDAGEELYWHMGTMDYEKMESREGTEKREKAMTCMYAGNHIGIERFYSAFPSVAINAIGLLIYSVIVFRISPWILLYMFVSAAVLVGLSTRRQHYLDKNGDRSEKLYAKSTRVLNETMEKKNRHDIILYHAKEWMSRNLEEVVEEYGDYYKGYFRIFCASGVSTAILSFVRDIVVYVILIGQLAKGQLSLAELLLYIGAIAGYAAWVKECMDAALAILAQNDCISDYRDFLEYGAVEKKEITPAFSRVQGFAHEFRFENVGYRYDGNEELTLKNINLTLCKGEKVALVGENGAGKTTLVKLLTGLYMPTEGKIFMDGMDITELDKESYFKEFAVVFQDSIVVAASVAENVACSKNIEEEKVIACLKDAGLYEKVCTMKKGIHTMLTRNLESDGEELSGGEVQKLMLARALYRDGATLVLDEPTAALDPLAESRMYETYTSFGKDKTSVFISHRLSSTRFCDRICFLQNGEIAEEGTHEELMARNGYYANMFAVQAKYYKEQEENKFETEI